VREVFQQCGEKMYYLLLIFLENIINTTPIRLSSKSALLA
jgi:hypothetical protein